MRRSLLALALLLLPALAHAQQDRFIPEVQYRLPARYVPLLNQVLPPLPDSVPTAHGWSKVQVVGNVTCGDAQWKPGDLLGCVQYDSRVIYLWAMMGLAERWHTLKHEQAHLMWRDTGQTFSRADEERLCDIVATWEVMGYLQSRVVSK